MKKSILIIIFILSASSGFSQEWKLDFNEAKKTAYNEGKKIVIVFQGSDWCAPCMKLDKEILSTLEFKNYAKENFVLVKADFPRKKKNKLSNKQQTENAKLMEKYNRKGYFPHVVVLDKNANVLGEIGYKKVSPKEYIRILNSF